MKKKYELPIVFIHIPKTGGTSLDKALTKIIGEDKRCPIKFFTEINNIAGNDIKKYYYFSGHFGIKDCELIYKPHFITVIRNPVDRVLSLYWYWRDQKGTYTGTPETDPNYDGVNLAINSELEDFLSTDCPDIFAEISNTQSRYILSNPRTFIIDKQSPRKVINNTINKLQNDFSWFGTTNHLSNYSIEILKKIGIRKNVIDFRVPRINLTKVDAKTSVSRRALARIVELNEIDLAIFEFASRVST